MKKPMMMKSGKGTAERPQGKGRASGVNKAMEKPSIPQVVARNSYGKPSARQKM